MRWQSQTLDADDGALPGLERAGFVRSVQTPEFEGVTFHEVLCKSALNRIPQGSGLSFNWTINPMRGCSHACRYCFARSTHEYLDLDAGRDFDTQIVVKTNVAAVLRRELHRRSWRRETVALGTNTDPYQRAEGRYRLMPGIIRALTDSGTPFSILTKGTLLRRDLPLLTQASGVVPVSLAVSIAILDQDLHRSLEPGTPSPRARLELVRALADAGFAVTVLVAPVIPYLTDGTAHLDAMFAALADAGAASAVAFPMHLRGSTRGWFLEWLATHHPALLRKYRQLYGRGAYVTPEYSAWLRGRIEPLLARHGLDRDPSARRPATTPDRDDEVSRPDPQLALFA
ncbi:Rv2578c family radical SAM protein [Nocardia transvalensis]|uniref:Rv2578c family radical SAM protein n=1 Tax=Nocardia transvalensis TaxID=37333 RepID=UPI001893DF7F|nr:Rv2578c family radical SAM protein [Nocardia transvalensis]MBF6332096.1 Rv2578c family radical SAM protein [Nocardia transvalensis]